VKSMRHLARWGNLHLPRLSKASLIKVFALGCAVLAGLALGALAGFVGGVLIGLIPFAC